MKSVIVILSLLMFSSTVLAASPAIRPSEPLLTKSQTSGFAPPEFRSSRFCDITAHTATITVFSNTAPPLVKTLPIVWSNQVSNAKQMKNLIKQAAKGKLKEGPPAMDAPTVSWLGFIRTNKKTPKEVVLKRMMGRNVTNDSNAADTLVEFLNLNCELDIQ